jgi:hypothetical protein
MTRKWQAVRTTMILSDRCAKVALTAIALAAGACNSGDEGARCGPGTVEVEGECLPEGAAGTTDGGNGGGRPGEVELPPDDTVCVRTPVSETEVCGTPKSGSRSVDAGNIVVRLGFRGSSLRSDGEEGSLEFSVTVPDGAPLPYQVTERQVSFGDYWYGPCRGGSASGGIGCYARSAVGTRMNGSLVEASPTRVAGWINVAIPTYGYPVGCGGDDWKCICSCGDWSVDIRFNFRP